jgi:hypothetical protein
MTNPLIQIDDEIREMTDAEYAVYLEETANTPVLGNDETPGPIS